MEAQKRHGDEPDTVADRSRVFARTVEKNPEKSALRTKRLGLWHDITFDQFCDQVEKIGCALVSLGFEKGDTACIIGDNAVEWVVADLGIQCVGGVSAGIYATNAWQQVAYVVTHSDATVFVCGK
ncbi:MAG: AMP-binding protein [Desulfotignum sp.]|nr:AMP-binding protein [Desulfotignum sp.]